MRAWGAGLALFVAACGRGPRAADAVPPAAKAAEKAAPAPPAEQELVLRARLKGYPAAPSRDAVLRARAFTYGARPRELQATATVSGDALKVVVPAHGFDSPASVWIVARVGDDASGALVFVESLRGEMDLGELGVAKSAPLFVGGKVLARSGKPAQDAWTCVVVPGPGDEPIAFPDFGVATDSTGAFVIHGEVRPADKVVQLATIGDWFMRTPAAFSRGQTSLELIATNTADALGQVVLPKEAAWREFVVLVRRTEGSVEGATVVSCANPRRVDGGFEFPASPAYELKDLPAGEYEVRLAFAGSSTVLDRGWHTLRPGFETEKFPRLEAGPVSRARVRVVSADARVPAGARLWAREAALHGAFREVAVGADGGASVPFMGDAVELVARGDGTDYASATAKTGTELTLSPPPATAARVTVSLPEDAPRADGGLKLEVRLAWIAATGTAFESLDLRNDARDPRKLDEVRAEFPAAGGATVTVPRLGWYCITLLAGTGDKASEHTVGTVQISEDRAMLVSLSMSAADVRSFLRTAAERRR
jgi:hypothetical protein